MPKQRSSSAIFDKIFELKWAEPFEPFALTLDDGQRFVIARWDTIGRTPSGKIIVFSAKGEGGFHRVPITQIVAVSPIKTGKAPAARAKSTSRR